MKTIRLFFLAVLLFFIVSPFITYSQKKNLPGTIFLKHNLYIDETPVCNFGYGVYADFLSRYIHYNLDSFEVFTKALPFYNFDIAPFFKYAEFSYNTDSLKYLITDTTKTFWNSWIDFHSYLHQPRFNYFPVVNISPQVAESFCRWRTYLVKLFYAAQLTERKRKKLFDDFVFRLPTNEELAFASKKFLANDKLDVQNKSPNDSLPNFNFLSKRPKTTFFKISSLNEISSSKNVLSQTSWDTKNHLLLTSRQLRQNETNENLTFRCVCEIR